MFPNNIDCIAAWQRYKEFIREADLARLARSDKLLLPEKEFDRLLQSYQFSETNYSIQWEVPRRFISWIGVQMVYWGCKLQGNCTPPSPYCQSHTEHSQV